MFRGVLSKSWVSIKKTALLQQAGNCLVFVTPASSASQHGSLASCSQGVLMGTPAQHPCAHDFLQKYKGQSLPALI